MPASAILGAQWGDEGKGKLVDVFAKSADVVVRFQGGPNAGHTIVVVEGDRKTKLVLHHIPSGMLHDGVLAVMAEGMVIDPTSLLEEVRQLEDAGVIVSPERLQLSLDAQVILPVHRAVDRARESSKSGGAIGTTLRGMGPAYEDRTARRGIRFRDLSDRAALGVKLDRLLFERNALLRAYGAPEESHEQHRELLAQWHDTLGPFLAETQVTVGESVRDGKRVLYEGAQGAMLDLAFGTYPYVTSSHTVTGGITIGAGVPPTGVGQVMGVTKAYTTRVGAGPFPSELHDDDGNHLATQGHEFGATTGRPRRCGWLDLVALSYAHDLCGFTSLALTKLDVLSGLTEVAICTAYETADGEVSRFPRDAGLLANAKPILETFPGWDDDISGCQSVAALPDNARRVVERIGDLMALPVSVVSVGAPRDCVIIEGSPLWG